MVITNQDIVPLSPHVRLRGAHFMAVVSTHHVRVWCMHKKSLPLVLRSLWCHLRSANHSRFIALSARTLTIDSAMTDITHDLELAVNATRLILETTELQQQAMTEVSQQFVIFSLW